MRQWLRAAILGSNDGIVSTSALMLGSITARLPHLAVIGFASIVAGAMSMAVGEYISVRAEGSFKDSAQASASSALSYSAGGAVPFIGAFLPNKAIAVIICTLLGLIVSALVSNQQVKDKAGNSRRIIIGGLIGILITAGVGYFIR